MRLGILAKKIGMSRFYDSGGVNHPVTIVKIDNSKVVDIRTIEKNGYNAICLSYGDSKKAPNKITKGFLKKKIYPLFYIQENLECQK
jgi:large subunit ribosomal protein L3